MGTGCPGRLWISILGDTHFSAGHSPAAWYCWPSWSRGGVGAPWVPPPQPLCHAPGLGLSRPAPLPLAVFLLPLHWHQCSCGRGTNRFVNRPRWEGCTGRAALVEVGSRSHSCGCRKAGTGSSCPTLVLSSGEVLAGCCFICRGVRQTGTPVVCALCVRAYGAGADSSVQLCPFAASVQCFNPAAALLRSEFPLNPLSCLL